MSCLWPTNPFEAIQLELTRDEIVFIFKVSFWPVIYILITSCDNYKEGWYVIGSFQPQLLCFERELKKNERWSLD